MSTPVSFKIFFSSDNVRRFRTESRPTFEAFVSHLQKLFPLYHAEMRIQYTDSESDKIEVASEPEWNEMFKEIGHQNVIKLYVTEPESKGFFKDAPPPLFSHFYNAANQTPIQLNEGLKHLQEHLSPLLGSFFPNSKILPHNLPSFLQDAISVKVLPGNEVDLDINVHAFADVVDSLAIKLLSAEDRASTQRGKEILQVLLHFRPDDARTLYNLACAESLLGNAAEALSRLQDAVDKGFGDLEHMRSDPDLANIRKTEIFLEIVRQLEAKAPQSASPVPPREQPVPSPSPSPIPVPSSSPLPTPFQFPFPPPQSPITSPLPSPSLAPVPQTPSQQPAEAAPTRWAEEIKVLHDMGFFNDEVIVPLLQQNNGSVDLTVSALFQL